MVAELALYADRSPRASALPALLAALLQMYGRARQRRALAGLDERLLADIGLTREEVAHETRKPFWSA